MIETLAVLGLAKIAESAFTPVLEDIAKQAVVDISSSYIGKAFDKVFSVVHKQSLSKATGHSLKGLLDEIENELLDHDLDENDLKSMLPHLKLFIEQPKVVGCFEPLFLDPDYKLDPKIFSDSWNAVDVQALPEDFSWQRVAKRFERKVEKFRNNSDSEIKETFDILQASRNSDALVELKGLPPSFDIDTYREALIERFGNLNLDSIDTTGANYNAVRLWSVFVPQSARECHSYNPSLLELPKDHQKFLLERKEIDQEDLEEIDKLQQEQRKAYFDEPARSILDTCNDSELDFMVILGDPGSGKSTLLQFIALEWAKNENPNERYSQPLPILIELRDYNLWQCNEGKGFLSYLHKASNWHRLNQQTLNHMLNQDRRVILLLDGLDEVFDPAQREQVINDIHRFSNEYKNTRIILTSRIVGYKARRLRDAGFQDFMLQDLDEDQIDEFLERWHDVTFEDKKDALNKRERLSKAIKASQSINMLAGNPLLLTMMSVINRYQELPRDRVSLYRKSAEVLLQQWDTERGLEDFPEISREIDLRAKTAILSKVAYYMQTNKSEGEAANIITNDALTGLIEDYLKTEMGFSQSRAAANALVNQLRQRNFILCFLGAGSYAFVHRTFLEYFCAAEIVHKFQEEQSLSIDGLIDIFIERCEGDDWNEVLRLICGQIDESFVSRIIEELIHKVERDSDSKSERGALPEIVLAVWCLGEIRNTSKMSLIGTTLLNTITTIFTTEERRFRAGFYNSLLAASKTLHGRWPGAKNFKVSIEEVMAYRPNQLKYFPKLIVPILQDNTLAKDFIRQPDFSFDRTFIFTYLAKYCLDYESRDLIIESLRRDGLNSIVVARALNILCQRWKDDVVREFIWEVINSHESMDQRLAALRRLSRFWGDNEAYDFCFNEIKKYENNGSYETHNYCSEVLRNLDNYWVDDKRVKKLLVEKTFVNAFAATKIGQKHSVFGGLVFTSDLDGLPPYLDPRKGLSEKHLEQAIIACGLDAEDAQATVKGLSAHLGWDITLGSEASRLIE